MWCRRAEKESSLKAGTQQKISLSLPSGKIRGGFLKLFKLFVDGDAEGQRKKARWNPERNRRFLFLCPPERSGGHSCVPFKALCLWWCRSRRAEKEKSLEAGTQEKLIGRIKGSFLNLCWRKRTCWKPERNGRVLFFAHRRDQGVILEPFKLLMMMMMMMMVMPMPMPKTEKETRWKPEHSRRILFPLSF
jgi:hypothetical protein